MNKNTSSLQLNSKILFKLVMTFIISLFCLTSITHAQWHEAIADPSLVARKAPSVASSKLGNIPYGGKVNVVEKTDKHEFIGGREGNWVKIQWKNTYAYVFDAFLVQLENKSNTIDKSSKIPTPKEENKISNTTSMYKYIKPDGNSILTKDPIRDKGYQLVKEYKLKKRKIAKVQKKPTREAITQTKKSNKSPTASARKKYFIKEGQPVCVSKAALIAYITHVTRSNMRGLNNLKRRQQCLVESNRVIYFSKHYQVVQQVMVPGGVANDLIKISYPKANMWVHRASTNY